MALTSDDVVWYGDYSRGYLGRLDPTTGQVQEFPMPGGAASLPYGMASDDKDRIWVTENGMDGSRLVGFDPKTKRFFSSTPVGQPGNNTIRHMYFDPEDRIALVRHRPGDGRARGGVGRCRR